jgi:hypothetical protein
MELDVQVHELALLLVDKILILLLQLEISRLQSLEYTFRII